MKRIFQRIGLSLLSLAGALALAGDVDAQGLFGNPGALNRGSSPTGGQGTAFGGGGGLGVNGNGIGGGGNLVDGSARYIRENRQPGAFVGATSTDAGNFVGAAGTGGQLGGMGRGAGQMGQLGGRGQLGAMGQRGQGALGQARGGQRGQGGFGFGQQGGQRNQQPPRIVVSVAFDPPSPSENRVSQEVTSKVSRSLARIGSQSVEVMIEDRTAILRGTVPTNHARNLAEQLARLEPGISRVQNELVVEESP